MKVSATSLALGLFSVTTSVLSQDVPTSGKPLFDVVPNKFILQFEHASDVPVNKRSKSVSRLGRPFDISLLTEDVATCCGLRGTREASHWLPRSQRV